METRYFVGGGDPALANGTFGNLSSDQFNPLLLFDQSGGQGQNAWFGFPPQPPCPTTVANQFHQLSMNSSPAGGGAGGGGGGGWPMDPTPESVGWGGQAIPDNSGYRVPWFGRPKGKGNNSRNGRNRGRNANSDGRNNKQRNWSRRSSEGQSSSSDEILTVEEIIRIVRNTHEDESMPAEVYQGIRHFDSRTCSALLKDLSKLGYGYRAIRIFDWLRNSDEGRTLSNLTDVYTYTAMISTCIYQQNVDQALQLVEEMRDRNIERNVHTYTALMNVCIKCGKCQLALDTFKNMREDGIEPNVVTYNTLIDIHGKMGQWEEAVRVLVNMKAEGVEAVLRTYNTLIISCNMCNQPREALAVYNRLLAEGFSPNATTYNALISAYGKAGQLDKVMDVFQEMVWKGCERSVITYSSLISACEKAGQWEIALQLFNEMQREGCMPNTVTYNSLITACAQGAQWEKACDVFEQMRIQGCAPDVVTYTALISANERGGQWRRALHAYEQMVTQGCRPDAIVYNAIIDAVWETGVIWAQRKALEIFEIAREQGHFKQQSLQDVPSAEVNLHALTAGVAVLSLYVWLLDLKILAQHSNIEVLPEKLVVVTDKGRNSKEQGNLVVKEAVAALLRSWDSPFRPLQDSMYSGILEASGTDVGTWLLSPTFEEKLFSFFPCTNITPGLANQLPFNEALLRNGTGLIDDPNFNNEASVESRCCDAFAAVNRFESSHSLTLQAMGLTYLQHRAFLVRQLLTHGRQLNLRDEVAHDAVLLMDRAMSTSVQIKENLLELLSVGCLVLAMKQTGPVEDLPSDEQLEHVTDCKASAVGKMEWNLRHVLGSDTSAISTLRCIKLYLERLGSHFLDDKSVDAISGSAVGLVEKSMTDLTFLNCRPSVVAAAILYAERRSRGVIPYWPSILAKLTGYQDMSSPELTVAIRGAQKLCQQIDEPITSTSSLNGLSMLSRPSSMDISAMASMAPVENPALLSTGAPTGVAHVAGLGGLLNLDNAGSFVNLASLQSLVPATSSQSVEEDQVTANRIDGVVVAQGVAVPPRVVQGLTHVTSGFPNILPNANGFLGSNSNTSRMNPGGFRVAVSGGITETEVREN